VVYLKESLDAIIPIKTLALESPQEAVIGDSLQLRIVARKIKTVLNQDAPVAIARKCHKGISAELDDLRAISTSGKEFLEGIENENHKRQEFLR
jgi:DNA mismatch repair protein MutS